MENNLPPGEYDALRNEIIEWQNRRFQVLTASITVVGAVLGFGQAAQDKISFELVETGLMLFLSVACVITGYCGQSNAKIGTYIQVFHENNNGWETHVTNFTNRLGMNLNSLLLSVYGVMGIVALQIPPYLFKKPKGILGLSVELRLFSNIFELFLLPALSFCLFIVSLIYMAKSQKLRASYLVEWKKVIKSGTAHNQQSSADRAHTL